MTRWQAILEWLARLKRFNVDTRGRVYAKTLMNTSGAAQFAKELSIEEARRKAYSVHDQNLMGPGNGSQWTLLLTCPLVDLVVRYMIPFWSLSTDSVKWSIICLPRRRSKL